MKEDLIVVSKRFYEQIKALPIVDELKERYNEVSGSLAVICLR